MPKPAPTEEAKMTAIQLRKAIFAILEAAIDNRWAEVEEDAQEVIVLAKHCRVIEESHADLASYANLTS